MSRYYLHEKMLRLNADSLNVAPPADIEECRLRATLVAMSGGQMFLGDRFDLCEKDRFDLIRQVIPPYGRAARPVDLFENVYPESHPRLWHLPVDTGWDHRDVVAVVNCERDMDIKVDFRQLGITPPQPCHLWEFWEQQYLGHANNGFSLASKCPSSRLIAIVPERPHPWVLSTSFHFAQGACELESVSWNEENATLSGMLVRPSGSKGNLIIIVPLPYHCSLEEIVPNIHRYSLSAQSHHTSWSIRFEKTL